MALFEYRGTDERGAERAGRLEAPGLLEAAERLREQGVLSARLERKDPPEPARPAAPADAFASFNRSLAAMAASGLPLPESVRAISAGLGRGRFRASLERLEAELRGGRSFEEALAGLPSDFPPTYRWMVAAGAASGDLPGVLRAVARDAEGRRRGARALSAALSYPALLVVLCGALIAGSLIFFAPFYRDLERRLAIRPPLPVRAARALAGSPALLGSLVALAVAGGAAAWLLRKSVAAERGLHALPFAGSILGRLCLARFLGTLGALLGARAPLPRALPLALGACGSRRLEREAARMAARAVEGASLEEVLAGAPLFPPEALSVLSEAERRGELPRAAEELSSFLAEQAASDAEALQLVLFPAAILAVGGVVLAFVVSMLLPYFRFLESLGR